MLNVIIAYLEHLKMSLGLGLEDCQHTVIDDFLCTVAGCAWGTDVCNYRCLQKRQYGPGSTRFPFNCSLYNQFISVTYFNAFNHLPALKRVSGVMI